MPLEATPAPADAARRLSSRPKRSGAPLHFAPLSKAVINRTTWISIESAVMYRRHDATSSDDGAAGAVKRMW
jgi:hypothetical protein